MKTLSLPSGEVVELNAEGFIADPKRWTRDIAAAFARGEQVPALTEKHWKVIDYLREYFRVVGEAPRIRRLLRDCNIRPTTLYTLFPTGPAAGACKIAGLPTPAGCH